MIYILFVKYSMKKNIILKFGGTSLSSPQAIAKVKDIICKTKNVRAIVVSAPGKSEKFPIKVTDALILAHEKKENFEHYLNYVKRVFEHIIVGLGIYFELEYEFDKIISQYKKNKSRSYLVSRGEYLCGKILSKYMCIDFVDSKNLVKFSKNGKILKKTYKKMFFYFKLK